jgi:raffinose/stachyose/melibiose transport system substrate-binding protein
MDRRELLKRSGAITAGAALAGGAVPVAGLGVAAVAAQDTEFDVWTTYNEADGIRAGVIDDIGAAFGEANGVTFAQRTWPLEELQETLPRSVDSDQGPDVSQVNNGESLAGPMARGGQILTLKDYDAEYGWSERFAAGLLARCMFTADGVTFGEGELWGLPAEAEIVGFYYNKQIFADNGLEVPATFEGFETVLGALRDAGVAPLMFGNLDKWQAIHLFGEIHGTNTTREFLDSLIYRRGGADFTDPSITEAAQRVLDWNEAGYLMDGFDGVIADDAQAAFIAVGGGVLLQGSWAAGAVRDGLGENAGFFLMPPLAAASGSTPAAGDAAGATPVASGGKVLHVGGVGIPYSITTNAGDPDVAASFIDTLVSDDSFNRLVDAGLLPLGEIGDDKIVAGTVNGDLYAGWNAAVANDAIGHYMDWAAPGFYDPFTAALQELLGAQVTAEEFAATLQEFYAASFA